VSSIAHRGFVHLGMDVSKDSIAVAVLSPDRDTAEVDKIFHDADSVRRLVKRLGQPKEIWACYEAGPTGYDLQRLLTSLGVRCDVVAPSLIPMGSGDRVLFRTAATLATELEVAHKELRLPRLLAHYRRFDLVLVDELGYLPFARQAAELLFQFFSDRYERASVAVTSNLPFAPWTEIFSEERLTAALLDRLIHRGHILVLEHLSFSLIRQGVTGMDEPRHRIAAGNGLDGQADRFLEHLRGTSPQPSQEGLDLGERLLDRGEVWGVGRQVEQLAAPRLDSLVDALGLVGA
jgi:hypothetical protein